MRIRFARWWLVLVVAAVATAGCGGGDRIVVAAGTTVVDSGLIDAVADTYEAEAGVRVSVTGLSTAEALTLGDQGSVDVMIVHAPAAEAAFLADHEVAVAAPVFTSGFVLVGPPGSVDQLDGLPLAEALAQIAEAGLTFVSRADGSGTHERELQAWDEVGIEPSGQSWYLETGQGMGLTLQVASERGGFALAELGAFSALQPEMSLNEVELGETVPNTYRVIVPVGRNPDAAAFATWLTSTAGGEAVVAANLELFGSVIYEPAAPGG